MSERRRVGAYLLEGELGRGGMGTVWRARGPDGAIVAIKLLTTLSAQDAAAALREQRMQAQLSDPTGGFVPLLDAGQEGGLAWLVMPLLSGGNLRDRLRRGPLSLEESLELVRWLARALGWAHGRGIVHRDLKPENVLFDDLGQPRLADLGLAKSFLPDPARPESLTSSGAFVGTPGYMAPEQATDGRRAGPAADVFGLGALLFACLSGEPPFSRDPLRMLREQGGAPPTLASRGVRGPAWVERVLARCLDPDPARRYPHAGALADALDAETPPPRPSGRAFGPALAALLLLGGGLGGAAILRRERGARAGPPLASALVARLVGSFSRVPQHERPVNFVLPAPDGSRAISTSEDGRVLVWDFTTPGRVRARTAFMEDLPGSQSLGAVWDPTRPDRVWVAGSGPPGLQELDLARMEWTGAALTAPPRPGGGFTHPWALSWSPDDRLLAGLDDGRIVAWSRDASGGPGGAPELIGDHGAGTGPIYGLDVDEDGQVLSASQDGTARVWRGGQAVATHQAGGKVCAAARFLRDARVALAGDGGLRVTDPQGERVLVTGSRVNALACLADGRLLAADWDGSLTMWGPDGHGQWLARERQSIGHGALNALGVLPDGRCLGLGSRNGWVGFSSNDPGVQDRSVDIAHAGAVTGLALDPAGDLLSCGADGLLARWRPGQGVVEDLQELHPWQPRCVAFLGDGELAVVSPRHGLFATGSLSSGQGRRLIEQAEQVQAISCGPTGRLAVLMRSGGVVIVGQSEGQPEVRPVAGSWTRMAWLAQGALLLGGDAGLLAWVDPDHLANGELLHVEGMSPVTGLAALPAGGALIGTASGQIYHLRQLPKTGPYRILTAPGVDRVEQLVVVDRAGLRAVLLADGVVWGWPLDQDLPHRLIELPDPERASCLLVLGEGELLVGTSLGRLLRYRIE